MTNAPGHVMLAMRPDRRLVNRPRVYGDIGQHICCNFKIAFHERVVPNFDTLMGARRKPSAS